MAIPLPLAEFICAEHRYSPLPRRVLLLGRQTMTFGVDALKRLAQRFGLDLDHSQVHRDTRTTHAKLRSDTEFVSDTSFFAMLGVSEIDAIDHSDFEGANIILDLTKPIPSDLHGRFDFIFNGSVLDNIWDPPELMRNISRLASAGCRIVHVETATASPFSYSALSPSWYFDYYVANRWRDCKVYLAAVPGWDALMDGPWAVMAFDPRAEKRPNAFTPGLGDHLGISVVLAEKGPDATIDEPIIQSHYRSEADWREYLARMEPISRSTRPLFLGQGGEGVPIASHRNVWLSCGWWGEPG